jgi:hypothetical protein
MSLKIQQGQLVNGLNVAQAASYATIAAQKHEPGTPIYGHMTKLVERLVDMALIELEQDKAEQPMADPLPDPVAGDTVQ